MWSDRRLTRIIYVCIVVRQLVGEAQTSQTPFRVDNVEGSVYPLLKTYYERRSLS
jgi:hypothetical protein